jgi:predicted lipid-binding transport protein (Tim44 family)
MRKTITSIVIGSLLTIGMTGCATHKETGAAAGGLLGGGTGAVIGVIFGGEKGAIAGSVIGVLLGTTAGAVIGEHFDEQAERTRAQSVKSTAYKSSQGPTLVVSGLAATPRVVRPGDEVKIKLTYDVLAPDPTRPVPVTETWVFMRNNEPLTHLERPLQKAQGGHSSIFTFTLPWDALPGEYIALVTVSNGAVTRSAETRIAIQS